MSETHQEREIGSKYVVVGNRPWTRSAFEARLRQLPGDWTYISRAEDLDLKRLKELQPRYVFFPHWSIKVPDEITTEFECICFHETDVPYGRGGSPIQNLIERGHRDTVVSALRMTKELDAGPVYEKRPLDLSGSAQEIYVRAASIMADMIENIIRTEPLPVPQQGEVVAFRRRTPAQSEIPCDVDDLERVFDHIRMLDAEGYPHAFLHVGSLRFEFSRASLLDDAVEATVRITRVEDDPDD